MPIKPPTSYSLIKKLAIIDENILVEAANQPLLYMEGAKYRVAKMRKRAEAVARLESEKSLIGLKLRRQKDETGKKAHTEDGIKARTELALIKSGTRAALDRAYEFEELSKLLLQALQMRRDAIRVIAEAHNISGMREDKEISRIQELRATKNRARDLLRQRKELGDDEE